MNTQTLCIPHAELPAPHSSPPRRNGKIARLPKATRDLLNHRLDDNLPYHVIIDELGEAGEGLSPQNLSHWVQGGYQDYLRQQERLDQAKAQMEFALDLLRECPQANPAKVLSLLATECSLAHASLKSDQSNLATKLLKPLGVSVPLSQLVSSQIKADQGSAPVVEVRFQRAGQGGILPPLEFGHFHWASLRLTEAGAEINFQEFCSLCTEAHALCTYT
ncbi:MAG TPA: hypothetical protein VNZ22_01785 [Bacillota bacterium]|nr:hypothetical protein [Bacillota bacterium]